MPRRAMKVPGNAMAFHESSRECHGMPCNSPKCTVDPWMNVSFRPTETNKWQAGRCSPLHVLAFGSRYMIPSRAAARAMCRVHMPRCICRLRCYAPNEYEVEATNKLYVK